MTDERIRELANEHGHHCSTGGYGGPEYWHLGPPEMLAFARALLAEQAAELAALRKEQDEYIARAEKGTE